MKANDASTKSGKNAGSDENILKRSSSFTEINMQGLQIKHKGRKSQSKSDTDVKDVDNSSLAKSPESKKRTEAMKSDNINTDNKQALSKGAESKMVTVKKEKSVVENKDVNKNLDVKSISEISKQRKSKERKTNQISENKSKSQSASAKNISVAPNKKEAVLARKLDVTSEMEKKDKELSLKSKSSHSEKQKTKIHDKTDSSRRDGDKKHRDRSSSRSSSVSSTSSRHARDSKKSKREHHSSKSKSPATKLESGVSISVSLKKDDPNNSNKHDKSKSRSSHRSSSSSTKSHAPDSLKTVNSRNHKSSRDKRDHSSSRKSHSKTNSVAIASPITDVIPKNNVDKRVSSSETKANVNIEISSQTSSKPVTKADSEVRTSSKKGNKMEEKEVRREDKKRSNTHKNLHHKNSSKSKTVNNDSVAKSKHNRDKKTCKQEKVRPSPKKANEILMDKPEINKEVVISVDNSKVNNNFENKDLSLRDDVNTKEEEEEANSVLKKDESLGDNVNIGILEADNVLLENHPLKQKGDQNLESTPNEETSNVQEVIGIADNISVNDDFVKQDINPGDDGTTETLEENRGLLENQPLKQKVDKKLESTPNEETSNVEEGITFADNITVNDNDNITVNDNFEENDMSVDDVNTKKLEANRVLSENHSSTQKVDQSLESVANEEASNETIVEDKYIDNEDIDNANEVTKNEIIQQVQETTENSIGLKDNIIENEDIDNANEVKADCNIKVTDNESVQLIQATTGKSIQLKDNVVEDKDIDNTNDVKTHNIKVTEIESVQLIQETTELSIQLKDNVVEDKDIDNPNGVKTHNIKVTEIESIQLIQQTTDKSIQLKDAIVEDKNIDNDNGVKTHYNIKVTESESIRLIQETEKCIQLKDIIIEGEDIDNTNEVTKDHDIQVAEKESVELIQETTEKSTELKDSDITVSDNESFHLIQETPEKLTEPKLNITEDKDTANESKRDCNKVNENESIKHIQDIDHLITVENRNASLTPNVDLVDSKKVTDTEQDDLKVLEDSNVNISEEIIIKDVCAKDGEEIISTNVKNYEEFRGTKEFPNNNLTESKKTDECFAPGNETVCEGDMIGLKSGVIKQTNNVSTIMEKLIPKNDHSTKNVAVKSRKEVESSTRTKLQKIQDAFEKYLPTKSKENKPLETSQQSTSICKNLLQDDLPPDVAVISKEERSTGKRGISMLEADPVIEEKLLPAPVKKTKFDEISVIVSTSENPKLLGPLSISPKKKERKSIESIISHLREGKSNEEITKNSTNIEAIDVTVLKEKLLLKIKNTSEQHSVKALDEISSDSVDQTICKKQANLISGDIEGKEVSDSNMEEDETFHISENVEKEVAEDMEKGKVSHNVQIPERSQTNENECPVELLDDSQKDNLKHQVNAVRNVDVDHGNKEPQSVTLIESQLVCQETKNKSDISTPSCEMCPKVLEPMTPTSKEILSSDLPESLKIIDNYDNQNNIVAHISTSNDFINSPVIEEDVIVKLEAEECSQHSLNEVIESSFVEDSLHISTSLTTSFTDLMMHVDQDPTSVTNMGEITVSPEDVCMLSDIISTSISSGENKLPCVSSTSHIKLFTFPVTTQADIKDHFIPLGDVTANKNASLEKLGSREDKGCVFSFSERTNIATSETLSSTELSLNLQADPFSKISIGSTRTLDLISTKPLSVVQTASNSNFMGNVPVSNEISDIITEITCSGEADDHNYTMGSIGGPLLSGRPEEKNILSTTYNKLLVETSEFPLNDNPLQEFPEFGDNNLREIMPDDTYKLNLDNEYAVKNVVMLAGQTSSDASAFPLSNYNLADIERINLIECNIPNSEENSNSKEYLDLSNMEQNQKTSSNDVNPWSQFIMNENPNQKVVVLPNEQCLMSSFSISQNDLIESFNEQVVENLSSSASVDKICPSPPLDISGNILEKTSTSPEISTIQKSPDAQKPKEPNVLKNNLQKSKKNVPDKSSPKDLRETDFLPRRRYSRTVLKAPKKKTTPSPRVDEPPKETTAKTTDGISSVPTKKVTPALGGTNPTVENKLPSVEERPTELFNLKSLKLDSIAVPTSHNAVNRSLGPSLEVLLKQPEIEKVTPSHLPVPHNSTPDLRKTVENQVTTTNVSESPPKDGAENIVKNPEDAAVTETKRTAKTVQQTVEGAIEPETEKLEVQTNIADHVKANKRAATNKYNLNNYSPSSVSMVKEAAARKTETKLKLSTVERSTVESAPGVAEVKSKSDASNPEKEHRKTPSYKSPGGRLDLASAFKLLHQLNDKRKSPRQSGSNSQKNSPNHHAVDKSSLSVNASTVRKTETKLKQSSVERATAESTPGVVEAKPKCDISNAEREHRKTPINKSPGGRLNFISAFKLLHQLDDKRKSPGQTSSDSQKNSPSHALDKTSLSVHASTRKTLPAKNAPDQPVAETPKKPCNTRTVEA
ncbi:hypothetical protein NQ318_008215 [Aromia moschata]|uniref:PHD finger protein 10 n=1 Tax=Aromia moschata TaxID=1265417 RepID=A0AAV8YJ52_9CUCU|nr:hypothetical protein NQ318_008215 [Aromia moschata]